MPNVGRKGVTTEHWERAGGTRKLCIFVLQPRGFSPLRFIAARALPSCLASPRVAPVTPNWPQHARGGDPCASQQEEHTNRAGLSVRD